MALVQKAQYSSDGSEYSSGEGSADSLARKSAASEMLATSLANKSKTGGAVASILPIAGGIIGGIIGGPVGAKIGSTAGSLVASTVDTSDKDAAAANAAEQEAENETAQREGRKPNKVGSAKSGKITLPSFDSLQKTYGATKGTDGAAAGSSAGGLSSLSSLGG